MSLLDILSDHDHMLEMYSRLGEVGWSADAEPTLVGIVSNTKTFLKDGVSLTFTAEGEHVGLKVLLPTGLLEAHGLSPQRTNALLDVMGILPTTNEWMAWYREGIWEGIIPPS